MNNFQYGMMEKVAELRDYAPEIGLGIGALSGVGAALLAARKGYSPMLMLPSTTLIGTALGGLGGTLVGGKEPNAKYLGAALGGTLGAIPALQMAMKGKPTFSNISDAGHLVATYAPLAGALGGAFIGDMFNE